MRQRQTQSMIRETTCLPGNCLWRCIREVGWDQDDVWFAHCCCLDDDDCKLYASKGLGIAHCPSSNMRLASGIAPVAKWLDSGVSMLQLQPPTARSRVVCLWVPLCQCTLLQAE